MPHHIPHQGWCGIWMSPCPQRPRNGAHRSSRAQKVGSAHRGLSGTSERLLRLAPDSLLRVRAMGAGRGVTLNWKEEGYESASTNLVSN